MDTNERWRVAIGIGIAATIVAAVVSMKFGGDLGLVVLLLGALLSLAWGRWPTIQRWLRDRWRVNWLAKSEVSAESAPNDVGPHNTEEAALGGVRGADGAALTPAEMPGEVAAAYEAAARSIFR